MSIVTQINSTKFRSLKYGGDRLNGGSSNQPYIQTPILDKSPGTGGPDFLLRGGLLTPGRILNDVSRITQMFIDIKSPNGLLFAAKQNILSLTEVNTKAGGSVLNNILDVNSKIYLPTSTIAQVALTAEGGHLSKQGIVPQNLVQSLLSSIIGVDKGRLVNLYNNHIAQSSTLAPVMSTDILYSYGGGPGSVLGIGRTDIKIASDRTGLNNKNYQKIEFENLSDPIYKIRSLNKSITDRDSFIREHRLFDNVYRTGASQKYNSSLYDSKRVLETDFNNNGQALSSLPQKSVLELSSPSSLDYYSLISKEKSTIVGDIQEDFRTQLTGSVLYSKSLNYQKDGINGFNNRINFNFNPNKPDISNYNIEYKTSEEAYKAAYDKINVLDVYRSNNHDDADKINDLVKFRIAIINNDRPDYSDYIHFRAYIDNFSDSYNSEWNSLNYVGRGEKFYRYNGFTREISLGWTVVAHSRAELAPMYRKLNYLASSLTPDYKGNGYMKGNMVKLTIGGYLYEQLGIITSLTYDIPSESPWEIGIGTEADNNTSYNVKELPHIIRVTGFKFIPIHNFVPQIFNGDFGKQNEKFIALSNGTDLYKDIEYKGYSGKPKK